MPELLPVLGISPAEYLGAKHDSEGSGDQVAGHEVAEDDRDAWVWAAEGKRPCPVCRARGNGFAICNWRADGTYINCCNGGTPPDGYRLVEQRHSDHYDQPYWVYTNGPQSLRKPAGRPGTTPAPQTPAPLAPDHRDLVGRKYGLDDAMMRAAALDTIEGEPLGERLKWEPAADAKKLGRGILIPYRNRDGSLNCDGRVRLDTPWVSAKGEGKKYLGPKDTAAPVFYPPGITDAILDNPAVPLIITEGEFKSLKAVQEDFPCVAIGGVDMWSAPRPKGANGRGIGQKVLGNGLEKIAWAGRKVYVVFDSDKVTNQRVLRAERDLAKALRAAGADVRLITLPPRSNGDKCGLDEFLIDHGADALRKLLNEAAPDAKAGPAPKKSDG